MFWIDFLTFFLIYSVYHLTAFPSVPGGDSGELLAEACVLGIAHPPGYPLFILLSYLATYINVPRLSLVNGYIHVETNTTVAWNVNHLCLTLGALAALSVGKSADLLSTSMTTAKDIEQSYIYRRIIKMIASMLFAFSPLIWEYSITAEVFALNNFFCALLLYLTLSIWQTQIAAQSNFNVYIGALVCGLAMSNQHASLLSIGPLILSVVYHLYIRKGTDIISILIPAGFLFLIGLLPYIYLYVATSGGRSVRGSWGDTSSISGMLRHMLRAEYGTFRLGMVTGSETFLERIVLYIKHGSQESYFLLYPLVGIVIFSIGMSFISQHRKNKRNVRGENKFKSKAKPNEIKRSSKKAAIGLENEQDNYDKSPEAAISSNSSNMVSMKIVIATWLFYVSIWHGVLSNLPLNAPMPYGVHARFWMQPDIFVYALAGAGLSLGYTSVSKWTRLQSSSSVSYILPLSGLVLLIGVVLKFRFVVMDKSSLGWVMHKYGEHALQSLPAHALLLSHTDLDWNPIRYLRNCEGLRSDVTHLSLQMMPYPWFPSRQAHLYSNVSFPNLMFPGISTIRTSDGNAKLVWTVLTANHANEIKAHDGSVQSATNPQHRHGGIFIDMQAINEVDIQNMGRWRGFILLPWGTLFRVYGGSNITVAEISSLHVASYQQLQSLQRRFPTVDAKFSLKFPAGTWESAAANVFYDAHYQFALNLLTYTLEVKASTAAEFVLVCDRSIIAAEILGDTLKAVQLYGTISSAQKDVEKNAALAWMKALSNIKIGKQLISAIKEVDLSQLELLNPSIMEYLTSEKSIKDRGVNIIASWIRRFPKDKDIPVFKQFVDSQIGHQ